MVPRFPLVSIIDVVLGYATIHRRRQTLYKVTGSSDLDDPQSATLSSMRKGKSET